MDIVKAVVLGMVQGLTEFLPVSSSGHLVIAREILEAHEALVSFDVLVHLGTLVSVILVFRRDVARLVAAAVGMAGDVVRGTSLGEAVSRDDARKTVLLIVVASVPTALIGFALGQVVERLFASKLAVGAFLIATGIVLWISDRLRAREIPLSRLGTSGALFVGMAQGLAVVPGFSRSGATISACLLLGLRREDAARFSFLLSIPVILGAAALELPDLVISGVGRGFGAPFLAGAAASIVSGYVAIHLVFSALRRRRLTVFAAYTWLAGAAVLAWELIAG
ncbi:MAG: undecaprenyl-diphosphate phosphatase [Firmicutes bacterium]|jgi:undecaprenyl-diphosphatase|nr:undecaprenyl-diphosphate phosphatase [Bacillota bacterium]MDH7495650.1 undecaprenyl-diphosphate phosphatase [Bacillota bacterium]